MKKILITGASGLLGSNLAMISRKKYETFALYNQHEIRIECCQSVKLDLSDAGSVLPLVNKIKPDHIVHCAALVNVDECEVDRQKAYTANVIVTENIAKAAKAVGSKFTYISTDSVFDGKKGMYKEQDAVDPRSYYAQTKLKGEQVCQELLAECLIARTCVYGWSATGVKNFAEWVHNGLKEKKTLTMFTDVFFTPILANDLSEMILKAIDKDLKGIYHISGSQRCAKIDFAEQMTDIFGFDSSCIRPVLSGSISLKAPRPKDASLDVSKISKDLGVAMPDLRSGLKKFKSLLDEGYVDELKSCFPEVSR